MGFAAQFRRCADTQGPNEMNVHRRHPVAIALAACCLLGSCRLADDLPAVANQGELDRFLAPAGGPTPRPLSPVVYDWILGGDAHPSRALDNASANDDGEVRDTCVALVDTRDKSAVGSPLLVLETWGGLPGDATFTVTLDEAHELRVVRKSFPTTKARALPRNHAAVVLSPSQADDLLRLAEAAHDFQTGCNVVADGTNAGLRHRTRSGERRCLCEGARQWPLGRHTKALLEAINRHFPHRYRVY
jgi:hypothetical protein